VRTTSRIFVESVSSASRRSDIAPARRHALLLDGAVNGIGGRLPLMAETRFSTRAGGGIFLSRPDLFPNHSFLPHASFVTAPLLLSSFIMGS
jgi:hypothetical protein